VGLIREAARQGDLAKRFVIRKHPVLRPRDPPPQDVAVRRLSKSVLERAREIARAQAGDFGQSAERHGPFELIIYESGHASPLPRRQGASQGPGDPPVSLTVALSLNQGGCPIEQCSGSAVVLLQDVGSPRQELQERSGAVIVDALDRRATLSAGSTWE
jgi:hypothetical protein